MLIEDSSLPGPRLLVGVVGAVDGAEPDTGVGVTAKCMAPEDLGV